MRVAVTTLAGMALVAIAFIFFTRDQAPGVYQTPQEAPGMGVTGNAQTDQDPYDAEIVFDGEVFSPSELVIKKGQRVRFINRSSSIEIWPASGVHPTHTLYPEKNPADCLGSSFDSCRNLAEGEFFDFTFNHAGTWRYHDHSQAYFSGTIIVE